MAAVTVDGDVVRMRPGGLPLGFALAIYGLVPLFALIVAVAQVVSLVAGRATTSAGVVAAVAAAVFAITGWYLWHLHFWDERVEATPTELRLRRKGQVLHRIDRDRLGATLFSIGSQGTTGKHRLKVYDHDGRELEAWPLRFGYGDDLTDAFYEASGVPGVQLLRDLREVGR